MHSSRRRFPSSSRANCRPSDRDREHPCPFVYSVRREGWACRSPRMTSDTFPLFLACWCYRRLEMFYLCNNLQSFIIITVMASQFVMGAAVSVYERLRLWQRTEEGSPSENEHRFAQNLMFDLKIVADKRYVCAPEASRFRAQNNGLLRLEGECLVSSSPPESTQSVPRTQPATQARGPGNPGRGSLRGDAGRPGTRPWFPPT